MQSPRLVIVGIVLALSPAPALAGETVSHPQLKLRLTVPDGFESDPTKAGGKVVYAFQRPPAADRQIGTFILVTRLGGVLGREKIDAKAVAAGNPHATVEPGRWKGFDVQVVRVPEQEGELQAVTFNVQVPLAPEAVQVAVFGDARDEEELRDILRGLLGNLEGGTNWLSEEQVRQRIVTGLGKMVCAGVVVALVLGAVARQLFRKRKQPREGRRSRSSRRCDPRDAEPDVDEDDRDDRPRRRRRRDEDDQEDRPRRREE